jgi:hypothetical protein
MCGELPEAVLELHPSPTLAFAMEQIAQWLIVLRRKRELDFALLKAFGVVVRREAQVTRDPHAVHFLCYVK